jgi:peroxiredoxin
MNEIHHEIIVGSVAPEFRLASSKGGEVGLADFRGKRAVALFFVREYI